MSVLDTFYILFKTNAEDVEKGTKKAKTAVDGLETGISGADKASIQLGKKFNTLATQALAAFASVYSVTQLISGARGIAESSSELGVLSDVLGESAAEIINWGRAVENMGGDSKAFQGSLRGLAGSLNDALINGPNAATAALAKMGISSRDAEGQMKTVLDILPDLAREFSGLTRESALARGASLGLDQGTILLLMEGEAAVAALVARQRGMNTVTDDQIEALRLLNVRWNEYKNGLSDVRTEILSAVLPALDMIEAGVKAFADVIAENQGGIMTFFKGVGVIVGALALKAAILALPFLLTVAAIGGVAFALGLLVEDIQKFISGEDSAIGRAAKRWQFFGDAIEGVKNIASKVISIVGELGEALDGLSFPDLFTSAAGLAGGFLDSLDKGYKSLRGMENTPLGAIGAQSAAAGVGGSSSRSSSVSVGEITIETQATDAAGIAAGISAELENQLSNAVEQTDDGIAA